MQKSCGETDCGHKLLVFSLRLDGRGESCQRFCRTVVPTGVWGSHTPPKRPLIWPISLPINWTSTMAILLAWYCASPIVVRWVSIHTAERTYVCFQRPSRRRLKTSGQRFRIEIAHIAGDAPGHLRYDAGPNVLPTVLDERQIAWLK